MDFDLDAGQQRRSDTLRVLVAPFVRSDDPLADRFDPALGAAIAAHSELTGAGFTLLDRVLLVEQASLLGAPIDATAALLLRPLLVGEAPGDVIGPIAIRSAPGEGPVRFGAAAMVVIDVTGAAPSAATVTGFDPVPSGAAAGYGRVLVGDATPLGWSASLSPLALVQLGRAAEIAGAATGAVADVAAYLGERQQFGRSLSTFQGLQHRLAELAVDARAASVSVRTAAHAGSSAAALGAAAYAIDVAARAVPELHQLSGARGFTFESGLPARTMRLLANRLELTASGASAEAYAAAAWGG